MKEICCVDCENCIDDIVYDCNDDFEIKYYCQKGSVLIEIEDPTEIIDCADFKQFVDDI